MRMAVWAHSMVAGLTAISPIAPCALLAWDCLEYMVAAAAVSQGTYPSWRGAGVAPAVLGSAHAGCHMLKLCRPSWRLPAVSMLLLLLLLLTSTG